MATDKKLVIVESPAKARTLAKFLGSGYVLKASMGHVRDLPKSKLGVDVEHDFTPQYLNMRDKLPVLKELKEAAKKVGEAGTAEQKAIVAANQAGDRATLKADSYVPLAMAAIFLALLFYFKSLGGYRALKIEEQV